MLVRCRIAKMQQFAYKEFTQLLRRQDIQEW